MIWMSIRKSECSSSIISCCRRWCCHGSFAAKMNEIVASSSTSRFRIYVLAWRLTVNKGRKGKSDFQVKKNAIFKRAREHNGQISREILASVYVTRALSGLFNSLILFRHETRAMLEEITAGNGQDRSMGDLISLFSRRDVSDPLNLVGLPADSKERMP